ncbi:hypothetical protein [Parabacteroides sp. PF5-6]|uniref:hypothetical protein n=1 Tax=Parabacteroides sp. PF5-6 TaxID=1742403 RepID=UPI0024072F4D|nr:hypothetical protein [Parabacteroides sp. PF5-6]
MWAQNNTNSPYTRFGYGEIADRSFAAGRAMGGIGIGLRTGKQVNALNPASYTSMDSMTFIFDIGAHLQFSRYTDGTNKETNRNGNFEYMAMQFPIHERMAMSIGLIPYSFVGYQFGEAVSEGDLAYTETFIGSGGLNEVYGGLSIDIWKKRLSVGANVGYLFGTTTHQQNVVFPTGSAGNNIVKKQDLEVRDLKLDFGMQYTHPLSATESVVLGAVFSPARNLNATYYDVLQVGNTLEKSDTITSQRFDLPNTFGVGASYMKKNKWVIGADVMYETWGEAHFLDQKGRFDDRLRIAGGAEYIPDILARNIFKRMRYRAGAHYSNSYTTVDLSEGQYGYKEYGASVGFGIPIRTGFSSDDNRSIINLSLEYVKVKPELSSMIDEQYFRITLNLTFNEMWFRKLKID